MEVAAVVTVLGKEEEAWSAARQAASMANGGGARAPERQNGLPTMRWFFEWWQLGQRSAVAVAMAAAEDTVWADGETTKRWRPGKKEVRMRLATAWGMRREARGDWRIARVVAQRRPEAEKKVGGSSTTWWRIYNTEGGDWKRMSENMA